MRVLIIDDAGEFHKGEYEAEVVIILFDWGYRVITRRQGVDDYCVDLEALLKNPKVTERHLLAVRQWVDSIREKHKVRGEP